mgnify:CR=1 FL=1
MNDKVIVKRNEVFIKQTYDLDKEPYYEICYKINNEWHVGFGSHILENVERWLNEYFIIC